MWWIIALVTVTIVVLAALYVGASWVLNYCIMREGVAKVNLRKKEENAPLSPYRSCYMENAHLWEEQPKEEHEITARDGALLKGYAMKASEGGGRVLLAMHGHDCPPASVFPIVKPFLDRGYNLFMPEMRANGASGGNAFTFGVKESEDALLWLDKIIEIFGKDAEIAVYGNSLGGATALLLSAKDSLPTQVKCFISDCSFSRLTKLFDCQTGGKLPGFISRPLYGVLDMLTKRKAGFSIFDAVPVKAVGKSGLPTLFVHGDADPLIPVEMCKELFDSKVGLKEIRLFPGAAHGVSYYTDPSAFAKTCFDFADRYMGKN